MEHENVLPNILTLPVNARRCLRTCDVACERATLPANVRRCLQMCDVACERATLPVNVLTLPANVRRCLQTCDVACERSDVACERADVAWVLGPRILIFVSNPHSNAALCGRSKL